MKTILTIAGSDCSGGAGIQADIKTITAHGMYAESAVTALTAQNTMGVADIMQVSSDLLEKQLDCIFTDIVPDAVKIGMISTKEQMEVIAKALKRYRAHHVVMDTVLVSSSGKQLMEDTAITFYQQSLLPLAEVVTPNLPEAELLLGRKIKTREERVAAVRAFELQYKNTILLKGGHDLERADDLLYWKGKAVWYLEERIESANTHGTGCTLSSAIACGLAAKYDVQESVEHAKAYITGAIAAGLNLGKGNGPLNHMFQIKR